jgi:hypothetical protein
MGCPSSSNQRPYGPAHFAGLVFFENSWPLFLLRVSLSAVKPRRSEKRSEKHGGTRKRLNIDAFDLATTATPDQLLAVDEALLKPARTDGAAARLVELRYFAGLSVDEAGKALGLSTATAYRHLELRASLAPCRASGS